MAATIINHYPGNMPEKISIKMSHCDYNSKVHKRTDKGIGHLRKILKRILQQLPNNNAQLILTRIHRLCLLLIGKISRNNSLNT